VAEPSGLILAAVRLTVAPMINGSASGIVSELIDERAITQPLGDENRQNAR